MHLTSFSTGAALIAAASALTTVVSPGFTMTLPAGIDKSRTTTIPDQSVTGTPVTVGGVAVVQGSDGRVAFVQPGGSVVVLNSADTQIFNSMITIIDGVIQTDADAASTTEEPSDTATTTAVTTKKTTTPTGATTKNTASTTTALSTGSTAEATTSSNDNGSSSSGTSTVSSAATSSTQAGAAMKAFNGADLFAWAGVGAVAAAVANY